MRQQHLCCCQSEPAQPAHTHTHTHTHRLLLLPWPISAPGRSMGVGSRPLHVTRHTFAGAGCAPAARCSRRACRCGRRRWRTATRCRHVHASQRRPHIWLAAAHPLPDAHGASGLQPRQPFAPLAACAPRPHTCAPLVCDVAPLPMRVARVLCNIMCMHYTLYLPHANMPSNIAPLPMRVARAGGSRRVEPHCGAGPVGRPGRGARPPARGSTPAPTRCMRTAAPPGRAVVVPASLRKQRRVSATSARERSRQCTVPPLVHSRP
jgi:hypothetical protein